jgi:MoaA/NifB/PqqE/SkfB family radical SAM enzyme
MQAMAACKARDIRFSAQMTVNALNQAELERVGILAAELGAASVSFGMTHATGRPDDARLYLAPEALDAVHDRVERLAGVLRIPVSAAVGFRRPERFQVCEPFRSEVLHVDPLGRLNLCCNHSGVGGCRDDVVGDLAQVSLAEAHRGLLRLVHRLELEQLEALEAGQATGWDAFPCNACLKRLGKPHWTGGRGAGPRSAAAAAAAAAES